ncbi:MAG: sulfur carrier protein ThiS [Steroidobacteraceae bacterium]
MRIVLNGAWREVSCDAPESAVASAAAGAAVASLAALLERLGFGAMTVATAVNGEFVPHTARAQRVVHAGDRVEVLAPMQGG